MQLNGCVRKQSIATGRTRVLPLRMAKVAIAIILCLTSGCTTDDTTTEAHTDESRTLERDSTRHVSQDFSARSVEHAYGVTQLSADDEHIIALTEDIGLTMLALGVKPNAVVVASTDNIATHILTSHNIPIVLFPETSRVFDVFRQFDPDIFVGTTATINGDLYETLSDLIPTIVIDSNLDWEIATVELGAILGQVNAAEALRDRVADEFGLLLQDLVDNGLTGEQITFVPSRSGALTVGAATRINELVSAVGIEAVVVEVPLLDTKQSNKDVWDVLTENPDERPMMVVGQLADQESIIGSINHQSTLHEPIGFASSSLWGMDNAVSRLWATHDLRMLLIPSVPREVPPEHSLTSQWSVLFPIDE